MVGVDPLDMARTAQRLQPADMGSDISLRVATPLLDDIPYHAEMLTRLVNAAVGVRHGVEVDVGGPGLGLGRHRVERDDVAGLISAKWEASAVST